MRLRAAKTRRESAKMSGYQKSVQLAELWLQDPAHYSCIVASFAVQAPLRRRSPRRASFDLLLHGLN
jgi:hypothetical protein